MFKSRRRAHQHIHLPPWRVARLRRTAWNAAKVYKNTATRLTHNNVLSPCRLTSTRREAWIVCSSKVIQAELKMNPLSCIIKSTLISFAGVYESPCTCASTFACNRCGSSLIKLPNQPVASHSLSLLFTEKLLFPHFDSFVPCKNLYYQLWTIITIQPHFQPVRLSVAIRLRVVVRHTSHRANITTSAYEELWIILCVPTLPQCGEVKKKFKLLRSLRKCATDRLTGNKLQ